MQRPRLVILGSGFAAYSLLKHVDVRAFDVTVVSRRNHFLFTPLLPSTTVGTVEFRTIIEPVRRCRTGFQFLLGDAEALDFDRKTLRCRSLDGGCVWEQPYDLLAIGVGAIPNTFGVPGVREHACFLKELSDARTIRERLVENLERASLPGISEAERDRLLHCVAVGGGPTGVRFAAELHDLLVKDVPRGYPHLAGRVRITLVEAGPAILSAYDADLRAYTAHRFARRHIAMRTGCVVGAVTPAGLTLKSGETIPAGLVLWSTGFGPCPFVAALPWSKDRAGRLLTDEHLQIPDHPGVYALGDCANPRGQNLPQLAQIAEQQGRYLAESLGHRARGQPVASFTWRNLGVSSYIGAGDAVLESGDRRRKRAGFWAYQLWRSAMLTGLVSVKNKILVPLDRFRAAVFGRELSKF